MLNGVAVTCLLASLMMNSTSAAKIPVEPKHAWLTKHPTIVRLHELQNQERARNGLPAFKLNPDLCMAAQKHANWMADTGSYTHSGLPWPEIIHSGPRSPEDAVNGWIWSPAHHGIMLSGSQAGFGYTVRNGVTYWVTLVQ